MTTPILILVAIATFNIGAIFGVLVGIALTNASWAEEMQRAKGDPKQ